MKTLTEHLTQYAEYHRDRRNIATHFVGIPMIVFAVTILLSRPEMIVGTLPVSAATLAMIASSLFYLRLDIGLGIVMTVLLSICLWFAREISHGTLGYWLSWGVGLFVLGWIIQFVGHVFEKRKPAFVDDVAGLIIGPLFVVAELGFLLGLRKQLQQDIEAKAGPTLIRT